MKPVSIVFGMVFMTLPAAETMAAVSPADRTFATNAAASGLAEVSLGQLAIQNAGSPAVRQFGQQMVTDHTQANQELAAISRQNNLTLPTKPNATDVATEQRLNATKGAAFDTSYMQEMVQAHTKDVDEFQHEANSGNDPALKAFAQKYLPVLQNHLQMAQGAKLPTP
jgi:putative membrane protein